VLARWMPGGWGMRARLRINIRERLCTLLFGGVALFLPASLGDAEGEERSGGDTMWVHACCLLPASYHYMTPGINSSSSLAPL